MLVICEENVHQNRQSWTPSRMSLKNKMNKCFYKLKLVFTLQYSERLFQKNKI